MQRWFTQITLLIVLVGAGSIIFGQSIDSKLSQKIERYDSEKKNTLPQLIELAERLQIPMGIEWLDGQTEAEAHPIHLQEITVKEIITHVLSQQPGYKSTIADGVVQVFPILLNDDRRNFLNIRFPNYAIEKVSLSKASYWLRILIERTLHPDRNMGGGFGGSSSEAEFDIPNINISGKDLTVRQILNKLVVAEGNALWVVHLNSTVLMEDEPFYASEISPKTRRGSTNFVWDLIPLVTRKSDNLPSTERIK